MALTKKEENEIIKNKSIRANSKIRTATKVVVILLILALLITGGTYGVMALIDANSMMITISDKREGLILSTSSSFDSVTSKLNMKGPEYMNCHTYEWFDIDNNILGQDGEHHGGAYICYSFYLKNVSPTNPCLYSFAIRFTKNTKNISSALRIMLIESDENCQNEASLVRVLAQAKSISVNENDETIIEPEYVSYDECLEGQTPIDLEQLNSTSKDEILKDNKTIPFLGEVLDEETNDYLGFYALKESGLRLSHNAYKKYTVVIWLEGTDLQCVNKIVGGKCSIQFEFELEEVLDEIEDYGKE